MKGAQLLRGDGKGRVGVDVQGEAPKSNIDEAGGAPLIEAFDGSLDLLCHVLYR